MKKFFWLHFAVFGCLLGLNSAGAGQDFVKLRSSTPAHSWHTFLGGSGADAGQGIAVDSSGNVLVSGHSNAAWGTPISAHNGSLDVFVAKFDGSGTLLWHTFLGASSDDYNEGIAVDTSGNVYVTGKSASSWGSPIRAKSGGDDAFVAKLSGSGVLLWNTFLGGVNGADGCAGIALDSSGNVVVRGSSNASWGDPVRAYTGGEDVFAAKLSGSGTLLWNTFLGGGGADYCHGLGIDTDPSGNVIVSGYTYLTSWGSPIRAHSGDYDAFAAKLDGNGNLVWNTFLGGSGSDNCYGVAVDAAGNFAVTGDSSASWGSPLRAHSGGLDVFAAKLNGNGALLWNTFLGGSAWDWVYDIAANSAGNFAVTGKSAGTWGSPLRTYSGGEDAFAAMLNTSGALLWNTFLGGGGNDSAYGITVDGSGNTHVTGVGGTTWGSPIRPFTSGNNDAFVAKIAADSTIAVLTATSPNGGESWLVGSAHNITWTSTGTIANVKIEYSTNGGTSYTAIIASTANTGTYAWTVPNAPSANCLVKVSDAASAGIFDTGNSFFTIVAPLTISVTSPNGGENWLLGSTHVITWTSTGTITNVKIEYSTDNGANWKTIIASASNSGSYSWTSGSPTDLSLNTLSTTCLVRVSDAANAVIADVSDAVFTISACGFISGTVTDPSGAPIPNLLVYAYDVNNALISSARTNASGQYTIAGLGGGSYKVLFRNDKTQNYLYEWYNEKRHFNAADPVAVTIGNTTGNINAQMGAGGIISGRVTDESGAGLSGVTISAWLGEGLLAYWSATTDGNGDYQLKGLPAGNWKVMFEFSGYPAKYYGNVYSAESATLISASLGAETSGKNIILEKGGWISGKVTDGNGNPVSGIQVIPYDAANKSYLRISGGLTAADGTYSILVRSGQAKVLFDASVKSASGLRSRFYSNQTSLDAAGAVNVVKDQTTPTIDAVLAAGGGTLTVNITNGLGQGVPAAVYLYSAQYESRMRMVAYAAANGAIEIKGLLPGNHKLKIYDPNGDFGRYNTEWYDSALTFGTAATLTVAEGGNTTATVVLNETSAQGTIAVSSPNGGENWAAGSSHNITWTSMGLGAGAARTAASTIKIEYSTNGGTSYTTIVASNANTGTYAWTVPNAPSTTCLVRISDAGNANINDVSDAAFTITGAVLPPTIGLNKTGLAYGAVFGSTSTAAQSVMVSNTGGGTLNWTVSPSPTWIGVSPASGTGTGVIRVSANPAGLPLGTHTGTVTVYDPNATNNPQMINVTLTIKAGGGNLPPFGSFDTPADGTTGITGAVPVTGWVVDDIEVTQVEIKRDPCAGDPDGAKGPDGLVLIGYGTFVEGARPDIEVALPGYPMNYQAGWGYMLLTNMLPGQGNGVYKLYAYAKDKEGNRVLLGTKTITCDNAHASKPFGTIDSPGQGANASGNPYLNFGWVLTPLPKTVPKDGLTILVYVDGSPVGNLGTAPNVYNQYRVDVSSAFPGLNNSGAPGLGGPVGAYFLDTTKYANGVHTISWVATDDAGAADGIGSRYFIIGAPSQTLVSITVTPANPSIAAGATQQFTATGTYSDNSTADITSSVTWSSSNTGVATISNAGLASSIIAGSTTITAASGSISGSTTLTVVPSPTLTSISVTPANPSISLGTAQQFTATGTYSDNSTRDITSSVTWSSSNDWAAAVNNAGLATSAAIGSTTITAAVGSVTGSTTLTVTAASPIKLFNVGRYPSINSIIESSSGHILVAGTQDDGKSVYALKLDAAGTQVWNKYYPATVDVGDNHIFEVSSGGYVVSGSIDATQGSLFKMSLDASGTASPASYFDVWRSTSSGDQVQLPSGSIVFAGSTSVKDNGATHIPYGDALLTGINVAGTQYFRQNYNFAEGNSDAFYSVIATSDGGFAAAGSTNKYEDGAPQNAILAKIGASGNLLWFKNFGYISNNLGNDGAIDLVQLSDGGYALLLRSGYGYKMYIIITDSGGNFIKAVNIENYKGNQLVLAADGGLVIAGTNADTKGVVVKLNSSGAKVWEYVSYFDAIDYEPTAIVKASDGTYIVTGSTRVDSEVWKTFVFKLDDAGRRVW